MEARRRVQPGVQRVAYTIRFDSERHSSRYGFNADKGGVAVPEMLNGQ